MWFIYISIAVLFRGAFCNPVIKVEEQSNCTVVITRFGEQVTTLEVKWNSDIYLICNASCVGPGPQPALTWFYRDKKNQSNLIRIERLFRSKKFETYPTTFHRRNELVIRDFGPNEETDFICKGSTKRQRVKAKVALIGTDCLLKYNFRCKLDNKCIDLAYLCNHYNECPDGEDEIGCDKKMNTTTTVATTRMPETSVGTEETSDESDYNDMTTTVSTSLMPQTDVKTKQTSKESNDINATTTVATIRMPEKGVVIETTSDETPVCSVSEFQCKSGTCIDLARKCNGFPDCPDDSDEVADCFNTTKVCSEGQVVCKDRLGTIRCVSHQEWNPSICISECRQDEFQCHNGQCISAGQRCDRQSQCTDGSDEINCTCPVNTFQCRQTNILECIDNKLHCDGTPACTDGSDEEGCKTTKVTIGINDDGDKGLLSTTDGVTDNTEEFTDTTPFGYDDYAN